MIFRKKSHFSMKMPFNMRKIPPQGESPRTLARGREFRALRGLTDPCARRAHFFLPQGEVLSAPHSLFGGEAAPLKTALPSADHSAPQAGTNLFLRPKAALFSSPRGRAPSPPFSFCRKKRTGRWSGPREKTPGAPRLNVLHEARKGPWIPPCRARALPASRVGCRGAFQLQVGRPAAWPRRFFSGTARRHHLFF